MSSLAGPRFNTKMMSYQDRKSTTVLRLSYLHNGISFTGKITSLYWIRALKVSKQSCSLTCTVNLSVEKNNLAICGISCTRQMASLHWISQRMGLSSESLPLCHAKTLSVQTTISKSFCSALVMENAMIRSHLNAGYEFRKAMWI